MKNTIEYYYNFENVSLLKSGKETYIKHKNYIYIFSKITNQEETIEIYNITMNIDVLPTVLNMLGIQYDSRLIIGKDIMASNNEGLVVFPDRSWVNNTGS